MNASEATNFIINIDDFGRVTNHFQPTSKTKKALLLLDFDETMVRSGHAVTGHLGGYKWRMQLIKTMGILLERKEVAENNCLIGLLTLFVVKAVQAAIAQPEVLTTITKLQSSGVHVMVFTARGRNGDNAWNGLNVYGIDELTEQQMHQVGIRLEKKQLKQHERIHNDSMIFCQYVSKDVIIKDIFAKNVFNKEEIDLLGFVDDSFEAVHKVGAYAKSAGIPYVGLHFTAIRDTEEKEYDLLTATIQLVHLAAHGRLLAVAEVETEKRKFLDQQNITPDLYFQEVVKRINRLFVANQMYKSFENTDQFFTRISSVFAQNASHLQEQHTGIKG